MRVRPLLLVFSMLLLVGQVSALNTLFVDEFSGGSWNLTNWVTADDGKTRVNSVAGGVAFLEHYSSFTRSNLLSNNIVDFDIDKNWFLNYKFRVTQLGSSDNTQAGFFIGNNNTRSFVNFQPNPDRIIQLAGSDSSSTIVTGTLFLNNWYEVNVSADVYNSTHHNLSMKIYNSSDNSLVAEDDFFTTVNTSYQDNQIGIYTAWTSTGLFEFDFVRFYGESFSRSLSVTAYDNYSMSSITSFNVSLYYPNGSLFNYSSTDSGSVFFNMTGLDEGNYSLFFISDVYQDRNTTIEYLNSSLFYEFDSLRTPAVNISVYDEDSNSLITENVSISFIDSDSETEFSTVSGGLYLNNITASNYTVVFSSENYTTRSYKAFLGSNTYQELSAYLIPSGSPSTVFTFKDKNNGAELESVTLSVESFVGGVYSTVAVLSSDITGKVEYDYVEGVTYRFTASKSGYEDKQFVLSPIIFNEYTVNLDFASDYVDEGDYTYVSVVVSPKEYLNNENNSVSVVFSSPDGLFSFYSFNASFGSESVVGSGSSVYGGSLSGVLEVLGAEVGDRVRVDYSYVLSNGVSKDFVNYYFVSGGNTSGGWGSSFGDDYGLGIFERLLIVVSVTLVVAGMISLFSNGTAGGVSALFIWGFFVWTKFISFWYVATSVIVIVIIVMWRSTR